MNEKIPSWLNILLILAIVVLFFWGGIKSLSVESPLPNHSFANCIPAGIFLIFYIILKIFLAYDLSTLLSVVLIVIGVSIYYYGITYNNKEQKPYILTAAGSIFGLGSGIPIGKGLSKYGRKL